jgi:uncharacterized protein (TIGR02145 family)
MMKITILAFLFTTLIFACYLEEIGQDKSSSSPPLYSSSPSSPSSSSRVIAQQESLLYGQSYKTIQMGSQIWLAENLNAEPSSGSSWCHGTLPDRCRMYGKLYDWKAAMNVCPDGWKLPSKDDYDNLLGFEDVLQNTSVWNAAFGGFKDKDNGDFSPLEKEGYWWSSTESGDFAHIRYIRKSENKLHKRDDKKTYGYSVRCIKK